jgi:hypothetical protein
MPLINFCHNEQKAIVWDKRHALLEWDKLQNDLQYTPKICKIALVKLISNYILLLLGMTTWGVGSTPLNVQAKVEHNEDLEVVI